MKILKAVNIVKEIETFRLKRAKVIESESNVLSLFEDVLKEENAKDAEMLKYFGAQKSINNAKAKQAKAKFVANTDSVLYTDVKAVCKKYDLKCLPAYQYEEKLPLKVLNTLRLFKDKMENEEFDSNRLFIIAPKSHFKVVGAKITDPVLLYRTKGELNRNPSFTNELKSRTLYFDHACSRYHAPYYVTKGDEFTVVDVWGKNFTSLRAIKGAQAYKPGLVFLCTLPLLLALFGVIYALMAFSNWSFAAYIPVTICALVFWFSNQKPTSEWWRLSA